MAAYGIYGITGTEGVFTACTDVEPGNLDDIIREIIRDAILWKRRIDKYRLLLGKEKG